MKEFTQEDLHDAMMAGINYERAKIERIFKNLINEGDYQVDIYNDTREADLFQNILKDKRNNI